MFKNAARTIFKLLAVMQNMYLPFNNLPTQMSIRGFSKNIAVFFIFQVQE